MTVDSQGNIYLAGNAQPTGKMPYLLPALPSGAFQSTHVPHSVCRQESRRELRAVLPLPAHRKARSNGQAALGHICDRHLRRGGRRNGGG